MWHNLGKSTMKNSVISQGIHRASLSELKLGFLQQAGEIFVRCAHARCLSAAVTPKIKSLWVYLPELLPAGTCQLGNRLAIPGAVKHRLETIQLAIKSSNSNDYGYIQLFKRTSCCVTTAQPPTFHYRFLAAHHRV